MHGVWVSGGDVQTQSHLAESASTHHVSHVRTTRSRAGQAPVLQPRVPRLPVTLGVVMGATPWTKLETGNFGQFREALDGGTCDLRKETHFHFVRMRLCLNNASLFIF